MFSAAAAEVGLKKRRSALTNDPRRLPGISMKSQHGRRFRDIVEALLAEYGDVDSARLREVATLRLTLEMAQGAAISGDAAAADNIVRLSHLIERKEKVLRARRRPKHESAPTLAEIAARHRGSSPA
jgi:hypothetical protein